MPTMMIRAELTKEQWRDLRAVALDRDVAVQQLVGDALEAFLRAQGYAYDELEEASA